MRAQGCRLAGGSTATARHGVVQLTPHPNRQCRNSVRHTSSHQFTRLAQWGDARAPLPPHVARCRHAHACISPPLPLARLPAPSVVCLAHCQPIPGTLTQRQAPLGQYELSATCGAQPLAALRLAAACHSACLQRHGAWRAGGGGVSPARRRQGGRLSCLCRTDAQISLPARAPAAACPPGSGIRCTRSMRLGWRG